MNLQVDVDHQAYGEALAEFIRHHGTTLPKALRSEGRQLALRLVKFTPPKTLSQGRKAVARDIQRTVQPLKPAQFDSKRIRQLIRKKDREALEAVFGNFPSSSSLHGVKVIDPNFPEDHRKARDRRGRVRKFQRVVTPDAAKVRDYIRTVQERVGRGRAGWAVALLALGGNTQGWIIRHAKPDTGEIQDRSDVRGFIQMDNRSEWAEAGDEDRIVANAIRSRIRNVREALAKAQAEAIRKAGLQ